METTPEGNQRAEAEASSARRRPRLLGALLLTAAATVIPGTAHLSRGRLRAGAVLILLPIVVAALAAVALTRPRQQLLELVLDPQWLLGVIIGAGVLALAWIINVIWSYTTVRPKDLRVGGKMVAGITVTALCLLVCAPLVLAANYAQAQRSLVTDIFPDTDMPGLSTSPGDTNPWGPNERLNILLLGGDADPSRPGVRTDVMIVASVDPDTGDTVLLSIPRNMQNAPMPFPALQQRFPNGYPEYLFSLWRYGVRHPQLVPGNSPPGSQRPGAHLLTKTIERILGLPIDHYALVDLDGFKMLINALGGVWIDVQKPIPYGTHGQFTVAPGYRALNGREALWYARSRLGTSDYDRMRRQRCMIGAIANQADPVTVLRNFRALTTAAKRLVSTNIPQDLLPEMVDLAPKVKDAQITNYQFVPPTIDTSNPNFAKIRRITKRVIKESGEPTASPSPKASSRTASPPPPGAKRRLSDTPSYVPPEGGPNTPPQDGRNSPRNDRAGAGQRADGDQRPPGKRGQQGTGQNTQRPGSGTDPVSVQAACPRITEPG